MREELRFSICIWVVFYVWRWSCQTQANRPIKLSYDLVTCKVDFKICKVSVGYLGIDDSRQDLERTLLYLASTFTLFLKILDEWQVKEVRRNQGDTRTFRET